MPITLFQEEDDTEYNIFSNTTNPEPLQTRHQRNIVDYDKFPKKRVNIDLANELGLSEIAEIEEDNKMGKIHESFDEVKRDEKSQKDERDTDGDGIVSWRETVEGIPNQLKGVVSQASATVGSGLDVALDTAKKVSLKVGDIDGDGDVDIHDLGAGVVGAGQNLREATGANDMARAAQQSVDDARSQMVYVGGAIVLAYLLIKM